MNVPNQIWATTFKCEVCNHQLIDLNKLSYHKAATLKLNDCSECAMMTQIQTSPSE